MTNREFAERVGRCARRADVHVGGELLRGLEIYFRLLEAWNEKINLTALDLAAPSDRAVNRLLIEPLIAARYLPEGIGQVIDIGSGGGSPAIPMQLARRDLSFTLVEAKTRKSAFLREAGRRLQLGVSVETCRFETLLSRPEMHEAFAGVTLRAVRLEARVLMGLQAFLRPGGRVLLFRGPGAATVDSQITPPLYLVRVVSARRVPAESPGRPRQDGPRPPRRGADWWLAEETFHVEHRVGRVGRHGPHSLPNQARNRRAAPRWARAASFLTVGGPSGILSGGHRCRPGCASALFHVEHRSLMML